MSYATKYRPFSLSDVAGNSSTISVLKGALKNKRIPNSIMLSGPSGCGKTTIARAVFNHLRCDKGSACGECAGCKRQDISDLIEKNSANARGIDEMRELIETARYKPQYARKRVIILDEIHSSTPQAQEALLKPLEDPPKDTIFILCTTEPSKLKLALRNRCQVLTVNHPSLEESVEFLQRVIESEQVEFPYPESYRAIYEQAGSSLRECVQLLESAVNFVQSRKNLPDEDVVLKFLNSAGISNGTDDASSLFVKAIYSGDYPTIHKILLDCEDYNSLMNSVVWLNSFLVDVYVTKGAKNKNVWWTPANKSLHSWFKSLKEKPTLEQTIIAQTGLIELKASLGFAGISDRHLIGAKIYRMLLEGNFLLPSV